MEELAQYRSSVDVYWSGVDRYLDELPGGLYRQGRLLRENLALQHSLTGAFHDILRRPDDHPLLHYHLWLLDDLGIAPSDDRTALERHCFAAIVEALCLTAVHRDLQATDTFVDAGYAGLADSLSRQGAREFSAVVARESVFWDLHRQLWDTATDAVPGGAIDSITEARMAPFMLSGLAILDATSGAELSKPLLEMLEHLNAVHATRRDLLAIRRDLARGTITAPVRRMMEAAGLSRDTEARDAEARDTEVDPDTILGSLLLSGAVDAVAPSWQQHIDAMERGASSLGLATFEAYARHLDEVMEGVRAVLRVPVHRVPDGASSPRFEPATTPLPDAIETAARYLTADPTFRDAWEAHRWGMAGDPEVTARFPAGLVIEVLGNHGHDVGDYADEYYRQAAEQGFTYYDHPDLPYRETDTIGTLLRLWPYTKQTDWHRSIADGLIDVLEAHVERDGRLPVWLVDPAEAEHPLLGERCATIEANLLRGLIAYDAERCGGLVARSSDRLFAEFAVRGAGITVNYPRPFLLSVLAALLAARPNSDRWDRLRQEIVVEAARDRTTPQAAAALSLACSHGPTADLMDERWTDTIVKGQSFDGSWAAEPMFFAPNRGGTVTWYASPLLTSGVCYDALASTRLRPVSAGA